MRRDAPTILRDGGENNAARSVIANLEPALDTRAPANTRKRHECEGPDRVKGVYVCVCVCVLAFLFVDGGRGAAREVEFGGRRSKKSRRSRWRQGRSFR